MRAGFVVIGRNEGTRLARCLASVLRERPDVVYVDSGSSDDSVQIARSVGVEVVGLTDETPFTAARARNAGFRRLREIAPTVDYVQFLDGDTELYAGWLDQASAFLDAKADVAVVSGRLRERHPGVSVYNRLCDIEWDTPIGEASACGGNALVRAKAFEAAGGFRESLMAGEEPELCLRLRSAGWRIWRLDADMATHDADIRRFSQWWSRSVRAGHAFAEGAHLYRGKPERHWVRESRRAWLWGFCLPLVGVASTAMFGLTGALVFALYPLQVLRLARRGTRSSTDNWWYALFVVGGKFPEALGQLRFVAARLLGRRARLIEYKGERRRFPRRIAYLVNQYPKGSHTFIRREIHALERLGFDIERIALRGWDAELADEKDRRERTKTRYVLRDGLLALLAAMVSTMARSPARFGQALALALRMARNAERPWPFHIAYLAEACRVVRWLKASGAAHVHAHFGTNSAEVAMLARVLGGPSYSFTVHGPEEFDKAALLGLSEKTARAAFVVAISSFGQSQLLRWIRPDDRAKVQVVHCGLEEGFHAINPPPASGARLVCVGRICAQKAQTLLVEAAARLVKKGLAFDLVLVGDGEMRAEVEALIARYGLGKNVRITGWVSNERVREELLAARALVLPSLAEGLPVVVMEAMALRRVAVSTSVGGIPELIVDGTTGWLIPAGNVSALADAMERVLAASVDQLAAMGEKARASAIARHSIDREAAKLSALLHEAVEPA